MTGFCHKIKIDIMRYRLLGNYKYQNIDPVKVQTEIKGFVSGNNYVHLSISGILTIEKGYAWDGPSGPTIDTKTFMRGSLVHDGLYQLMREGDIPKSYRDYADKLLRDICIEDGMNRFRAWYVYISLKYFGKSNTTNLKKYNTIHTI